MTDVTPEVETFEQVNSQSDGTDIPDGVDPSITQDATPIEGSPV